MQWWRVVGAVGRFMMRAGVLVLLFVAYQLWGTGLATHRAQDRLEDEFAQLLAETSSTTTSTTAATTTTTLDPTPTTVAPVTAPVDIPPPVPGAPVGRIEIPAIGVDYITLQGVDLKWLKEGPGHFPQTPLPGQPGNVAFAGHRTTYAAPFNRLDELRPGDEIVFETVQGTFTYTVDGHPEADGSESGHTVVSPTEVSILDQAEGVNRVTLVACHPKYSARQRIVVTATLASPPAPPTPLPDPADPASGVTTDATVDALAGGDSSAWGPAILWSLLALGVWFTTWWVARRWPIWHRVPAYVVGVPIFAVVLFVAYENIARLLPASY